VNNPDAMGVALLLAINNLLCFGIGALMVRYLGS
jgi:hypothetical protein